MSRPKKPVPNQPWVNQWAKLKREAESSWYCERCAVEVYERRCPLRQNKTRNTLIPDMLTNAEHDDAQVKRLVEAVRALLYRFGTIDELEAAFRPFRHKTDEQSKDPIP